MGKMSFLLIFFIIVAGVSPAGASPDSDAPSVLSKIHNEISNTFRAIDRSLSATAEKLGATGLEGPKTRRILAELCGAHPFAADCSTIDPKGRIITVEPGSYGKYEGSDISDQEQVIRLHETKKPVFSNIFKSVEGFYAVDLEYPLFSRQNQLIGSVSMLFKAETLLASIITPAMEDLPEEAWVMQKDGYILFDPDDAKIGRMLFDDPLYKPHTQLLSTGKRISEDREGSGTYEFLGMGRKDAVRKLAHWTTVGLYGTEWRVIVTREDASVLKKGVIKLPAPRLTGHICVEKALTERRSVRSYKNDPLTMGEISQVLWAAQGITEQGRDLRTAPSARARYFLEVYLVAGDVTGLQPGMYRYRPKEHDMVPVFMGDMKDKLHRAAGHSPIGSAPAALVITGNQRKTTNLAPIYLEAGHAAQNVYLQAISLNLGTVTMTGFRPDEVKKAMELPEDELPIYIMPLGKR